MGIANWLKSIIAPKASDILLEQKKPEAVADRKGSHRTTAQQTPAKLRQSYEKLRRYTRFASEGKNLNAHVVLTDTIELSNISTAGACILTTKTLRPGDNVLLKIPHEKVKTPLKCTIIWESVPDDVPACEDLPQPSHQVGMKFSDLTTDSLVQLKDFMRLVGRPYEQKLSDEYHPSPLRFRVMGDNQAKLNYPVSFPVLKVSLGGMLVETTCDFLPEERHPMAIMLPDDDRPLKFLGRVASRIPRNGSFHLGIEFMDMNSYDQGRLRMFLRLLPVAH